MMWAILLYWFSAIGSLVLGGGEGGRGGGGGGEGGRGGCRKPFLKLSQRFTSEDFSSLLS